MNRAKKVDGPIIGWMENWFGVSSVTAKDPTYHSLVDDLVQDYLKRHKEVTRPDESKSHADIYKTKT